MRSKRASVAAIAVLVSAVLLVPALAIACTPLPRSFVVVPQSAPARDGATVVGQGLSPGTPVEIVWNEAKGLALGTATADDNGRFSLPVAVPESAPGAHAIVFVARSPAGSSIVGRLPFSVTSSGGFLEPSPRSTAWGAEPVTSRPAADGKLLVGAGLSALAVAVLAGSAAVFIRRRGTAPTT